MSILPGRMLPGELSLEGEDVHVWRASLRPPQELVEELRRVLAPDELMRAAAFHFPRDRHAFIVARGLLRMLIGNYLKTPPDVLRFAYTPYNKPFLADATGANSLRFNLSHSHDLALYAFTLGSEVGIDIEYLRPEVACEEIAGRFFSRREVEAIRALPRGLRTEAFFNCWTRKEAFIKAVGEGLSFPLDQFEVSVAPGAAALLAVRGDMEQAARWSLRDLLPAPGYAAALAVEKRGYYLRCWVCPLVGVGTDGEPESGYARLWSE